MQVRSADLTPFLSKLPPISAAGVPSPVEAQSIWRAIRNGLLLAVAILSAVTLCFSGGGPTNIRIQVAVDKPQGAFPTDWNYFGYDEPNYTYAANGQKLLGELAALSPQPVYVRVHNLFTSGDGSASLKWGSTNLYTEDASGNPVYHWEIVDRIFDTFRQHRIRPLVEIGFMPEALSTHPTPYRHNFPAGPVDRIYTGWAYPPKDYRRWSELVFQFVRHLRQRYGNAELSSWLWEVWNEPDIGYWQGKPEEYLQLYDYSVDAVLRAFPRARVGGPDSTGPLSPHAVDFLRVFLEHCAHQPNYATGKVGSQLDFISFHPKGSPSWQGNHVQMGIARHLAAVQQGFKIVASFPEFRNTPIILGESDPEGCAACSARKYPQNAYRNGPLYACYEAEALNDIMHLASDEHVQLIGVLTWAFEFEGQPYFEGFRTLATNGIDKAVLNAFRMFGLLDETRVLATSSGAIPNEQIVESGVRAHPDINVIATRGQHQAALVIWNYHDDDVPAPSAQVDLAVAGLPPGTKRVMIQHFRVDADHSNAHHAWQQMGSPQSPSEAQYKALEAAGQLQLLKPLASTVVKDGSIHLQFDLPRQGLSLVRITW